MASPPPGKSTLAAELAAALRDLGRLVLEIHADDFHHSRDVRYRQGRDSANGYYEDAFDFGALAELVVVPLGPGGTRRYRAHFRDLTTDALLDEPFQEAPVSAVALVDGSFLQRPELLAFWDYRVFVDTPFEIAEARGVARDAPHFGGPDEARALYRTRYHAAARRYLQEAQPKQHAHAVFGNDEPWNPTLRLGCSASR